MAEKRERENRREDQKKAAEKIRSRKSWGLISSSDEAEMLSKLEGILIGRAAAAMRI